MLRPLVLLLLLANAAWFAWSQGHLQTWGLGPASQGEPHRLDGQLRPELLRIQRSEPQRSGQATGATPADSTACLSTPPLDEATAERLRPLLADWPGDSWTLGPAQASTRWIVYMGRYPNAEGLQRKRAELRHRGVNFETVSSPELAPGLSLGAFVTETEARQHLEALNTRGVRTAGVVQENVARGAVLRLAAADRLSPGALDPLRTALGSVTLRPCR